MILFKACDRCGGDIHGTSDQYGPYYKCLQCGYTAEQLEEPQLVGHGVSSGTEAGVAA